MSILSDTAHENMINSEPAVTYILKALFSDVFKFDGHDFRKYQARMSSYMEGSELSHNIR